ncbi:MAG TPA: hypothetical protein VF494_03810 [Candidatus Limnocylindrales bacterium]
MAADHLDSDGAADDVPRQRVTGRLRAGLRSPALGGLGLLVAAVLIVALVAWPNLRAGGPAASPSADASLTAGASPSEAASAATEVSAEPSPTAAPSPSASAGPVVDRPGVPAALSDRLWIWGSVYAVGTTARLDLPPGVAVLAAGAGRVATYGSVSDATTGDRPVLGPNGLVPITVRDFATGAILRTFDSPIAIAYGVMAGSVLFWNGLTLPLDAPNRTDGGVWAIDLGDPASTPRAIIAPSDLSATYGPNPGRSLLWLSDRGRAVMSTVGGDSAKATQIVDVASLALRATLAGEIAYQVVDGKALVDRSSRLALLDLATRKEIGPGVATDVPKWSVVGEREVFIEYGRTSTAMTYLSAIALDTGAVRDLTFKGGEAYDLSPELSNPTILALVPGEGPTQNAQGRPQLAVSLLDPVTGQLTLNAFIIGYP